jgi:hypothetical protein
VTSAGIAQPASFQYGMRIAANIPHRPIAAHSACFFRK